MSAINIHTTPAMQPPEGETSNLANPPSLFDSRIGILSTSLGLVLLFVSIRTYVRYSVKQFNSEDWVLIFATSAFIVLEALLIIVGTHGDGKHLWDISIATLYSTLFYENVAEIIYCVTMFPLKYVLLHQVKSIFFGHVEGKCISITTCITAAAALNVASDLSILALPMFGIAKLQLPLRKKWLIASVFAVGIFATIASCVRMYYGILLYWDHDSSWLFNTVGNWATIKFAMGFIVACSPYIPRFVGMIFGIGKKQPSSTMGTLYNGKVSSYGARRLGSKEPKADSSWIALQEQDDDRPFDGSSGPTITRHGIHTEVTSNHNARFSV